MLQKNDASSDVQLTSSRRPLEPPAAVRGAQFLTDVPYLDDGNEMKLVFA